MKYIILDTNIIIRASNLMQSWSPNYKFIIPQFLYPEIDRITSKIGISFVFDIIDNARSKGFILTPQEIPVITDIEKEYGKSYGLSVIDLMLAKYATELSESKKEEVILATNDFRLREYCNDLNLRSLNQAELEKYVNQNVTIDIDALRLKENIKQYQRRILFASFIAGCISSLLMTLLVIYFKPIFKNFPIWGSVSFIIFFGWVLFFVRNRYRLGYGILEYCFALYITIRVLCIKAFDINSLVISDYIQLVSGIYVMIRGLDNIGFGIKGTIIEPFWNKIFSGKGKLIKQTRKVVSAGEHISRDGKIGKTLSIHKK